MADTEFPHVAFCSVEKQAGEPGSITDQIGVSLRFPLFGGSIDTPEQKAVIFREEARIGRRPGDLWPDTDHKTTEHYVAFLKRVPDGSGLQGVLRVLAEERGRATFG